MNDQAVDQRSEVVAPHPQRGLPLFGAPSFFLLLGIFAVFYAVELVSYPLSIDDEVSALNPSAVHWVQEGRWTAYLFETYIMPQPVLPFLPALLFGVCLSLGYLMLLRSFGFSEITRAHFATFAIFVGFPTWYFLIEFQANTPPVGLAVLASCSATWLLARGGRHAQSPRIRFSLAAAAGGLGAIAIGAYQSNAMLLAVLGLAQVVWTAWNDPRADVQGTLRNLAAVAVMLVTALLLYFAIEALFLRLLEVSVQYVNTLINPGQALQRPGHVLLRTLQEMRAVYFGEKRVYGIQAIGFGVLSLAGLAALITTPASDRRVAAMLVALVILLPLIPFGLNPISVSDGMMAYRSLVAVPSVVWFLAFLGLSAKPRWLVGLTGIAIAVSIFQMLYVGNLLQASSALVRQHDLVTAAAVYDRIAAANPGFDRNKQYKVAFAGFWRFASVAYRRIPSSTAGASFFEWDNGNPDRMRLFMRLLGYANLDAIAVDQQKPFAAIIEKMPIWPAEGSVRVEGDVTLVKFSNPSP